MYTLAAIERGSSVPAADAMPLRHAFRERDLFSVYLRPISNASRSSATRWTSVKLGDSFGEIFCECHGRLCICLLNLT
jgi:hypothetical protein